MVFKTNMRDAGQGIMSNRGWSTTFMIYIYCFGKGQNPLEFGHPMYCFPIFPLIVFIFLLFCCSCFTILN